MRTAVSTLVLLFALSALVVGCDTSYVDSIDHMNEGIEHYKGKRVTKALESLNKAVSTNPENHRAHFEIGNIYSKSAGDYPKAVDAYKKAADLRPENSAYFYSMGLAQMEYAENLTAESNATESVRQWAGAKQSMKQATEVDEYFAEAYFALGKVHEALGEISEAVDAYSNSINADPTVPVAYVNLGMLYAEYSFLDEAQQVLQNGAANNPKDTLLQGQLGNAYLAMKRYEEAIHHFELASKDDKKPQNSLPAKYGLGIAHAALGEKGLEESNVAEAKNQFTKAQGWFDSFIGMAAGEQLKPQRMAASGKSTEIKQMMPELEEGKIPKIYLDQRKMNEEKALQQQNQ